jgi:hypothetical protein
VADLTEREVAMLDLERQTWRYAGSKDRAINDLFGVTATRYYQELQVLIDRPEALAHAPVVVKRLRRLVQRPTLLRRGGRPAV